MRLIFSSLFFSLLLCSIEGRNNIPLTEEEDLELEKELQSLNKPPVKTLKSFTGDLFDCIEMYKQPAFDHPALKDHKLQMRPSFQTENNVTMDEKLELLLDPGFNDTCPPGTVIIRRTRKEDLIMAKELPKYFRNYGSRYRVLNSSGQNYYAIVRSQKGRFHGFQSKLTTWALPNVGRDQASANQVWIYGDMDDPHVNVIQTGWHVLPKLYNDAFTRFFTFFTINGYQILKDRDPGNWWLKMGGMNLGYWPKELLPNLEKAKGIDFGGGVFTHNNEASPPMGNGHFPQEGIGKACYFKQAQYMGEDQRPFLPTPEWPAHSAKNADDKYYQILGDNPVRGSWDVSYGGPGRSIPLTEEEDLEVEKELQSLNKPPVKTLKSFTGDLFDCIEMYKQPAFDHPALKNHKLQIRPRTVSIRRTPKEELIIAKEIPKYFRNYGSRYRVLDSSGQDYYAIAESEKGRFHGFNQSSLRGHSQMWGQIKSLQIKYG
ncbi:uncharacterized protein LOC121991537 [Zingiber officinale]|uniref:uncharacterized protein LOC121991537 n=1 Tax=Zingiber officinale TaxID=94328 RepID=UPI001C4B7306|nr:uncharacterized protein LOC121991537 [Zingiber officinale]